MNGRPVASLVPGRACGKIETDPAQSDGSKILVLRQERLTAVSRLPAGLILVDAAPFSHAVIEWLGRGIPVAAMDAGQAASWPGQARVVLDCTGGELRQQHGSVPVAPWQAPSAPVAGQPVVTADGTAIWLCASIGGLPGARRAVEAGAAAIGLVRSEFLRQDGAGRPNVEFYRGVFAEILALAAPLPVSVRLLDLAADKWPPWLPQTYSGETISGLHGSQLYAFPPVREVVEAQLAAARDSPSTGRLRLIWPSGGGLEDFLRWRDQVTASAASTLSVGPMVETPIEMLALGRWTREVELVSVGCNDLLAHLFGADRDNMRQGQLIDPYRPEIYRLLADATEQTGGRLAQVQLCGLLPQVEGVLPVLIGLGFRRFSGEPALIPLLSRCVTGTPIRACVALAEAVCQAADSRQVRELLGVPTRDPWGLATARDSASAGPY